MFTFLTTIYQQQPWLFGLIVIGIIMIEALCLYLLSELVQKTIPRCWRKTGSKPRAH